MQDYFRATNMHWFEYHVIKSINHVADMEDYIIPSDAITFSSWTNPESTRWCVNILILDDNIVEDSEQLTLELVSTNPLVTVQENFSLITVNITEQPTDCKWRHKLPNHVLSTLYLVMNCTYRACWKSITLFSPSRCCNRNAVLVIERH